MIEEEGEGGRNRNSKEKSSDFVAAKLYYKMLSYKFRNQDISDDFESNFNTSSNETNKILKFNSEDDYE